MRASAEDITAMKARLSARQEQRRFDRDADEAIRMVHHRQPLVVEERVTAVEKREYVSRVVPAGRAFNWAAVALILARSVVDNWLFLLVLGFAVFGCAAVC